MSASAPRWLWRKQGDVASRSQDQNVHGYLDGRVGQRRAERRGIETMCRIALDAMEFGIALFPFRACRKHTLSQGQAPAGGDGRPRLLLGVNDADPILGEPDTSTITAGAGAI